MITQLYGHRCVSFRAECRAMQQRLIYCSVTIVFLKCCLFVDCYRILLVGPCFGYSSHLMELQAVGEALAQKGHEVYLPVSSAWVTFNKNAQRLSDSLIHELEFYVEPNVSSSIVSVDPTTLSIFETFRFVQKLMCENARFILQDDKFMELARQLNFDLAVVDRLPIAPCSFLVPHVLRIPYVSLGAIPHPYMGTLPTLPSIYENVFSPANRRSSFTCRLTNFISQVVGLTLMQYNIITCSYNDLLYKYAPEVDTWLKLIERSKIFFLTREYTLEVAQPMLPNIIAIPSLTFKEDVSLSAEFHKLMSSSADNGVIVVSFGTLVKTMRDDARVKFLQVFGRLTETVIWKMETNDSEYIQFPENVHVFSWIPQNGLLAHKHTKLFITHCGNNGQYESVYNGVPMIGFPLFAEQYHNADRIIEHGYGVTLNILTFTADDLFSAIQRVIANKTYKANVRKASAILRNYPMSPSDTVVHWIEHVIKYGDTHLQSNAKDLDWIEYLLFDVLSFCSLLAFLVAVPAIYMMRCCFHCLRRICC